MSLGPGLRSFLLADATISGLVGGVRIHPTILPQGSPFPAVTYSTISSAREHTMRGPDGLPNERIQIDSWALDYDQVRALSEAIRVRIDGYSGPMGDDSPPLEAQGIFYVTERTMYESEPQVHRISTDYFVWYED